MWRLKGSSEQQQQGCVASSTTGFPSFLPKEVEKIKDPYAQNLGSKDERLPRTVLKSYIRRPMILVGPSLGASVAIDFAVHHPIAVKGTGDLAKLPKFLAYAGVGVQNA
ncbi:hypothetical protein GBA52_028884 [Prunus armeniaca]|nr:hypothetical protein GBA52_028884 [Prunus armeniaca]